MIELQLLIEGLVWSSDWCGDEVGYDAEIVGLYTKSIGEDDDERILNFYIDMDTYKVLDMWIDPED